MVGLKVVQAIAEKHGLEFSVGDIEVDDLTPSFVSEQDGPQPKEIASRIVAHLGHRIPGVKRIEKRLEGRDKTSGIWSDFGILLGQLYYRNKPQFEKLFDDILSGRVSVKRNGTVVPHGGHVDFGVVSPNGHGG